MSLTDVVGKIAIAHRRVTLISKYVAIVCISLQILE